MRAKVLSAARLAGRVMSMYPLIHRLLDAHRTLGFRRMLWVAPLWLVRRKFLVLVRDLRLPLPEVPPHEPMEWTPLTGAEIPRVLALNPVMSEPEIRRLWREGQECILCWIGKSLAHYRWDTHKATHLPYLGKTLRLIEGEDTMDSGSFTHPVFRGRGIYTVSTIMALHRDMNSGLTRSITIVAWWNIPSLRAHLSKAGYTVAGAVGYWNMGLWRCYFATGDVCLDKGASIYVRPGEKEMDPRLLTPDG